jgi:hypothetical protein
VISRLPRTESWSVSTRADRRAAPRAGPAEEARAAGSHPTLNALTTAARDSAGTDLAIMTHTGRCLRHRSTKGIIPEASRQKHRLGLMISQTMIVVVTTLTFTLTSAFAGLDGINWHSDNDYISAHGRLELTSNSKLCTIIGKLECTVKEPGKLSIYYLLECDRGRQVCEAVSAKVLRGEPWLVKQEYQITERDTGHISAIMKDPPYQCLVTGLQIDFGSRDVVFTETYTKSIENDAFCVPENVGRTTTYKLDNY